MHHTHTNYRAPTEMGSILSQAYTELIVQAAHADPSLGPLALFCASGGEHPLPLHASTVRVLDTLSRTVTGDLDAFPALLHSLRELYEAPWLTATQLNTLLEVAARSDDLATAEHHGLTVVATDCGQVWTDGYGCELNFAAELWSVRIGNTTAYHTKLAQSIQLARFLRKRVGVLR